MLSAYQSAKSAKSRSVFVSFAGAVGLQYSGDFGSQGSQEPGSRPTSAAEALDR